jgi:cytochrome c-type biogenesis protein CcsB
MTTTTKSAWRVVGAVAAMLVIGATAWGQTTPNAPAGNAHPQTQMMTQTGDAKPFGDPVMTSFDVRTKSEFSEKVDVGPLRDLAVFHNGRLKIVGTLALETVTAVTGRKSYIDFVPVDGGVGADGKALPVGSSVAKKFRYDPVFTLIDMVVDPGYYVDKPLVHVEFLPLREAVLGKVFEPQSAAYEWWLKQGRLSPAMIAEVGQGVVQKNQFEPGYPRAIDRLYRAMTLYRDGWQTLAMVAPDSTEQEWHNLSSLLDGHAGPELKGAVEQLGMAWRAGDAGRVNESIRVLAAGLPKVNAANYPTTRRSIEATYNAANPFEWGYWLYFLSLLSLLLAFGTGRKWLVWVGVTALVAALAMHAGGFAARCVIAERLAIQNQFESMTGLSLGATLVGTVIMLVRRQWLFGAAAAGVGFMVLITATQTAIPGQVIEREAPILNTSVLLKYHVTTVLVSYGLISLGFMISLFYLATYYLAKFRAAPKGTELVSVGGGAGGATQVSAAALGLDEEAPKGPKRVLSDLDKAQMIVLQLAFWTLGVGILLGAWWADHSWGRWWAFDPKELWALITWIVYLIVIHMRFAVKDRGYWTAVLSVIGFIVMLWTYFGVNLLLPGLHAYA